MFDATLPETAVVSAEDKADPATPATPIGEFYSDITDILCSIGEGLSSAQMKMDEGALTMQKEIMEDETLSGYGLSAGWYVMPEAEFTMKMELAVSKEETVEATSSGKPSIFTKTKIKAALSNAKYNSLYRANSRQESTLRVRFVPVPMPPVIKIPDVIGLSLGAARQTLSAASVNALFIDEYGKVWESSDGKIATQSLPGGEVMLADKILVLTVLPEPEKKVVTEAEEEPAKIPDLGGKLSALKDAAGAELNKWKEEPIQKLSVIKARKETAYAAAAYVALADSLGVAVSGNARSVSGHGTLKTSSEAVGAILLAVEGMEKDASVAYVTKLLSFDHIPKKAATEKPGKDAVKTNDGTENALSALKKAADTELESWKAEPLERLSIIKARRTTAKIATTYVALADSLGVTVSDNARAVSGHGTLSASKGAVDTILLAVEGMDRDAFVAYVTELLSFDPSPPQKELGTGGE